MQKMTIEETLQQIKQSAYYFAVCQYQDDEEIAYLACIKMGSMMAHTNLAFNRDFVKKVAEQAQDVMYLQHTPFNDDIEIAKIALSKTAYSYQLLSDSLKNNEEIIRFTVKQKHAPYVISRFPNRVFEDKQFVSFMIQSNPEILPYLPEYCKYKDDPEIVRTAVSSLPWLYPTISAKSKKDFFLLAIDKVSNFKILFNIIKKAPVSVKRQKKQIIPALQKLYSLQKNEYDRQNFRYLCSFKYASFINPDDPEPAFMKYNLSILLEGGTL